MKYSQYNILLPDEGDNHYILYNSSSDRIISITTDIYNMMKECKNDIEKLQAIHPSFYEALQVNGFIVDDLKNEYQGFLNDIQLQCESAASVHLTINPTMDCNFRCWYCYENHNVGSKMDMGTFRNVKKLILNILSNKSVEKIVLSFFGGEPLLYYKDIMHPIIVYTEELCQKLEKHFNIIITTNGYLLSSDIIQNLKQYESVGIQIPIDGDRETHNKTKFLKDQSGSYNRVIANVKDGIKQGFNITIRCNYTMDNINSFLNVLEEFKDMKEYKNFEFAFHKIWQENQTDELHDIYEKVFDQFRTEGLISTTNIGKKALCYADYKHNLVVNFNGDVYKCTARDFNEENRLGVLNSNGTITWSEKAEIRLDCKYHSKACEQCSIFPICMQTCSQTVFEKTKTDDCIFGEHAHQISKQMLDTRIKMLMQ